jgi:hypothetical protein
MACQCKCCCGCCCDGETGDQTLESQCTSPQEFQGKGTICDVCCDLGEIREDITEESECPGTWVVNGRCLENPCGCETDEDCGEDGCCCDNACKNEPCDDSEESQRGFQAFDGSSAYYQKLGIYDFDCCYLGNFRPDDGYYVVEKQMDDCNRPTGQCVVVESVRWYAANGYAVGTVIACPSPTYQTPGVFNTATKLSLIVNASCCNGDGSAIYAELTEQLLP